MASSFVLDSSVIINIILRQQGARIFSEKIQQASFVMTGTPTLVESGLVLGGRGRDAVHDLETFVDSSRTAIVPFTDEHFKAALAAFLRYGKGRHPAALNFGDCMSYAVAKLARMPLLFTGDDFSKTDIRAA